MPHLSPLSWLIAPILFWSLLMLMASSTSFSNTPSFPMLGSSFSKLSAPWSW